MYLYRIKLPFLKITQNKVAYIANYSINRSMIHTEQLVECTLEIIVNKKQSFLSFSFPADNEPVFFTLYSSRSQGNKNQDTYHAPIY